MRQVWRSERLSQELPWSLGGLRRWTGFHGCGRWVKAGLTWSTELQKVRACVNLLSSGTAVSITGRGDCHSSTEMSREVGSSE